jgi:signal transduction histidine kinase
MKLLTKYSRINLIATIAIFIGASTAFYFTLQYVLLNQVEEDLKIERREITSYAEQFKRLPEIIKVRDQVTTYTPVASGNDKQYFSTVDLQDLHDNDLEKFRQLSFSVQAGGQWYKVTVSKSLEETDNLIQQVLLISVSTILIILLVSFIINRVVLKKLWTPFYQSLHTVKSFRISKQQTLTFGTTEIDEFNFMNATLQTLTQQAQGDYLTLKTFSENASHEIQTPIAIIRSKLDLLIQEEGVTQKQSESLESAYNAVQRLATLNHHLLLLAKIENNQFTEITQIDLATAVEKKLEDFSELWQIEGIKIHSSITSAILKMNSDLANILLNNLVSNATKYNYPGGEIYLELTHQHLTIKNTSKEAPLVNDKIFKRFYKPSQSGDSNGLGLSIIKQICDVSGFKIRYAYEEGLHIFSILFTSL